ncbi:MAG: AbiV family abortive infection protein, partial [Thaumarchaeota archaeon]
MIFKKKKEQLYKQASEIALDNSQKMYDEAMILYDREHYARGFALGIISLEESAKAFLFRLIS